MKRTAILILISIFILALSGCVKPGEEIKIGFIGPLTGDVAVVGEPVKDAVVLAVEEINAAGGIDGKQVRVIYEDGTCNGKTATTAAQKLISVDKVQFIIGGLCSAETLAIAPIAEAANVVLMSPASTAPKIKDAGEYIYRVVPSDAGQGAEAALYLAGKGYRDIAILNVNDEWGVGLTGAFKKTAETGNLRIVAEETFEPRATDMRTQLTKIKEKNPDAIYMPAFPAEAAVILKQAKELGITAYIMGTDASKDDSVIEGAGISAEGFVVLLPGVPDSPEVKSFNENFEAKYDKSPSAYTPEAYDVFTIAKMAFENTDGTGPQLKAYLDEMGEFKGASGTYEFDQDGEVSKTYDFFIVKNGKFVPLGQTGEEVVIS